MLAYQVWEWTTSAPAQASAIARSTPRVRSAALAPASSAGSAYDDGQLLVARRPEGVHPRLEPVAGAQRPDQLGHVDPRPAVDLRRVLLAEHVDAHGPTVVDGATAPHRPPGPDGRTTAAGRASVAA